MAKTEFLQIRLTPEDRQRVWRAAMTDHLDASTWARRAILQAVQEWEVSQAHQQRTSALAADDSEGQTSNYDYGAKSDPSR